MKIIGLIRKLTFNEFRVEVPSVSPTAYCRLIFSKELMPEMDKEILKLKPMPKERYEIAIDFGCFDTVKETPKKRGRPRKWDKQVTA
jgi:hypothetical protein